MLAEARVSRTHRRPLRTTAGFEDREDHRSLSTSVFEGILWRHIVHVTRHYGSAGRMKESTLTDQETVRLTQQVKAGGCASKLPAGSLRRVLSALPAQTNADLIVGFETSDDAGIYRIGSGQALVQTIDFFTPLVDDPFTFGQIAATNALSDVYAMGGRPITALSVVCFPQDGDLDVLEQIMRGGIAKMAEAGCVVVGGHSVRDSEIKFGYAVTGLIDPERVLTNAGAAQGDA